MNVTCSVALRVHLAVDFHTIILDSAILVDNYKLSYMYVCYV